MKSTAISLPPESPEKQLAGFIAKLEPSVAKLFRALRTAMRKRLPTALELVYDNYNFLVIGYCSTDRASDCIVSLAANAKGVNLNFYYGAALPDPHGILQGSGSQNRFLRLGSAEALERPEVEALIAAAVADAETPLPAERKSHLIIKSISAKQRPRSLSTT